MFPIIIVMYCCSKVKSKTFVDEYGFFIIFVAKIINAFRL